MSKWGRKTLLAVGCAAFAAGLSASSVGPDFVRPQAEAGAGYTPEKLAATTGAEGVTGGAAQRFLAGRDVPGQWWTLFHSKLVNAMIAEALRANPDIDAAQAALRQAQRDGLCGPGRLLPDCQRHGFRHSRADVRRLDWAGGLLADLHGRHGFAERHLCARRLRRRAPPGRVRRGAGRVRALSARGDLPDPDRECRQFGGHARLAARSDRRHRECHQERKRPARGDEPALRSRRYRQVRRAQSGGCACPDARDATAAAKAARPSAQSVDGLSRALPDQDKGEIFALAALRLPEKLPVSLPSKLIEQRPDVRAAEAQLHEASANDRRRHRQPIAAVQHHRLAGLDRDKPGQAALAGNRRLEPRRVWSPTRSSTAARSSIASARRSPPTTSRRRSIGELSSTPSRTSPMRCARCKPTPIPSRRKRLPRSPRPRASISHAANMRWRHRLFHPAYR